MTILISGGTGYLGNALIQHFNKENIAYKILTRKPTNKNKKWFHGNYLDNSFDPAALEDVQCVINLNGANVGEKWWTPSRKKLLRDSRIAHTKFLVEKMKAFNPGIRKFISCSAIGYYGDNKNEILTETSKCGDDFMAKLCRDWENAAMAFGKEKCTILRIGLVLGKNNAFEKKLKPLFTFRIIPLFGGGEQYLSWIHLDDVVRLFDQATRNLPHGVYNAVSENPITMKNYFDQKMPSPKLKVHVPSWFVKGLLGEKAQIVLNSYRVLPSKRISSLLYNRDIDFFKKGN
ncbi:MAG: TIGR01777 family oxidoreductase [Bacteroidota bacterium]|nr:TIGR01777 family oxidoreductase [Bacteroidota bacterium]